jgi:hypothetical protein
MAVTRIAEELHRCASSRRATERRRWELHCRDVQRRDAQWNSSELHWLARAKLRYAAEQTALSSGKAVLCDGKARQSEKLQRKRTASTGDGGAKKGLGDDLRGHAAELLGYALHCVGLAAKGRAKAQKSAARKSKCIEKQGH